MTTEIPYARCPIDNEPLILMHRGANTLYAIDPPWPGAGTAEHSIEAVESYSWRIECLADHVVWTSVDQIRNHNAALSEDDERWIPEDTDYAPTFDPGLLPISFPATARPLVTT